jgi:hypothetical protein
MDQFKDILLQTISEIKANQDKQPVVFRWNYPEEPDWDIVLGFKQKDQDDNNS